VKTDAFETSKDKDEVYFLVKDGGFWNPKTAEVLGGEPSKPSGGAKSSKASGKKGKAKAS